MINDKIKVIKQKSSNHFSNENWKIYLTLKISFIYIILRYLECYKMIAFCFRNLLQKASSITF